MALHSLLFLTLLGMQAARTAGQVPPEIEEYFRNAARAEESGDWSTAEQAYRSALELQPDFPPLHAKVGLIYQFQGRFREAVGAIEKALTLDPELPDAHFFLGLAHYSLYEYQQAIESFQQAISQNPENVKAQVYLGVCFLALQQLDKSVEQLEAVIEKHPQELEALQTLAQAYLNRTRTSYTKFQETFSRIEEIDPDSFRTHQLLAEAYATQGRLNQAIEEYEKAVALNPNAPGVNFALGDLYFGLGQYDKAEPALEKELEDRSPPSDRQSRVGNHQELPPGVRPGDPALGGGITRG